VVCTYIKTTGDEGRRMGGGWKIIIEVGLLNIPNRYMLSNKVRQINNNICNELRHTQRLNKICGFSTN
jgi:hypothetical protein